MRLLYYCPFLLLLSSLSAYAQCDTIDLALGRPSVSSSVEGGLIPQNAFDGNDGTRWGSAFQLDPSYLVVDLGAPFSLCQVTIHWEAAYATSYALEGSNDTTTGTWTNLITVTGNTSLMNTEPVSGSWRFVRMHGISRALDPYGYSIYEMRVFGVPTVCVSPANVAIGQPATATSDESGLFPAAFAVDNDPNTRWSSDNADAQSIYVDLGGVNSICQVMLHWWNDTYPSSYAVDLSNDASTWVTDTTIALNTAPNNVLNLSGSGRYVRVRGITRHNTTTGISLVEFGVSSKGIVILPVKLTDFTATVENTRQVELSWKTELETNNRSFDIERSVDGSHYTAIGSVQGAGNSSSPIQYQWTDSLPAKGLNYYRLNQVDFDGKSAYSPVVTATITGSNSGKLFLYPNPARDVANLVNPGGMLIREITIYNAAGIQVKKITPLNSSNTLQLSVAELSSGLYTLKVVTDKGAEVLKLLK
jgi:hypothetical protein